MASRAEIMRHKVQMFLRHVPFHSFVITMKNGDELEIEHPENIAFDVGQNGAPSDDFEFYVISGPIRYWSTFEAVTGVAKIRRKKIK